MTDDDKTRGAHPSEPAEGADRGDDPNSAERQRETVENEPGNDTEEGA
ncbi:hypothetical protein [Amycolatopsis sp. NPDC052450]